MSTQIVVTLLTKDVEGEFALSGELFVERLVSISQSAKAHGGRLCALATRVVAFAFHSSDLEEAAAMALQAVRAGDFAASIVDGEFIPLFSSGTFVEVGWGRALLEGEAIASAIGPGMLVVEQSVPGIDAVAGQSNPLQVRVGQRTVSVFEIDVSKEIQHELRVASSAPPGAPTAAALAERYLDLARQALIKGDIEQLDQALENLKPTGAHAAVVERLGGILAVTRGEKLEGLRKLRQAAETETRAHMKARARLAYAVALGAAGRIESALLEGLLALSSAREVDDHPGANACARFLWQLSVAAGHDAAAERWRSIVSA